MSGVAGARARWSRPASIAAIAVALVALALATARAEWPSDPRGEMPIGLAARHADAPRLVPDHHGGAIVIWQEYDERGVADLRAQYVDSTGTPLWDPAGVPVAAPPPAGPTHPSRTTRMREAPQAISDGHGGAIVVWQDESANGVGDWNVFAQRIGPGGDPVWRPEGMPVCVRPSDDTAPRLVSDGKGGAIVVWQSVERRYGGAPDQPMERDTLRNADVYAQRIDSTGAARWSANGVPVASTQDDEFQPALVADGDRGAYIVWVEAVRQRERSTISIGAQHLDYHGVPSWQSPVWIAHDALLNASPAIVGDRRGGAIVVYNSRGVLARRLAPDGSLPWGDHSTLLSSRVYFGPPVAIPAGDGGAIVTWSAGRDPDVAVNVWAQRIDANGVTRWGDAGKPVCPHRGAQTEPVLVRDDRGGAIVAWRDARNGSVPSDVYAQRMDSTGVVLWPREGVPASLSPGELVSMTMIPDGVGGAILAWQGRRIEGRIDAARLTPLGHLGGDVAKPPATH